MRTSRGILAVLFISAAGLAGAAEDAAIFEIVGRGAGGKSPYREGGSLRFRDAAIGAQVVHYRPGEELSLPLEIRYDVIEAAPVLLTSRLGTEYWQLFHFDTETMAAMYADEKIDLSRTGPHTTRATNARFGKSYGPPPGNGVVGIRGHYYFLIDRPDRKWIDVTNPPVYFDQPAVCRKLTFTLADLTEFNLSIPEIQSTWEPGGPFRVRLVVTDAGGAARPVVNAPLVASAGDWQVELATAWNPLNEPTGWIGGTLPEAVPEELTVSGSVSLSTPTGLQRHKVTARFRRGDGLVGAEQFQVARQGYQFPRTSRGIVRETRAIWVSTRDFTTAEDASALVDRCKKCKLNVIVPDIFVRNTFLATSDLMPAAESAEKGFDPLGCLIDKAHAAGLEVHPWFCVTYRDRRFRRWFADQQGENVDMLDDDGKVVELGADVHREAYRRFIVDLMVGVARDYPVDGIHLDYIRSMGRCYCDSCRREFARQFGKPLNEATDDEWICWQRQAIGDIVRRTAEGVRQVRPNAKMSAAVFANLTGGANQGQDSAGWAQQKWIDLILPMDYKMQTLHVRANERQFLEALADDDQLVTGLSLYMRSGGDVLSRSPELVQQQIELVRQMGIHGYCLFAYGHLSEDQARILAQEVNQETAVPHYRTSTDNRCPP